MASPANGADKRRLCVSKHFPVVEGNLQLGIFAVEIVFQAVQIAGALPFAHRQVVEQVVAASLRPCGGHLGLRENPLQASDGQLPHVLHGVCSRHDDIHAREAAHGSNIHHVILHFGISKPSGHQVLQTVHGSRSHGRLLVWFGDTQVKGGEALVLSRNVDARLQVGVVDGETLYNFHNRVWVK